MRPLGVAKSDVGYTKIQYTSGTERITKFRKLYGCVRNTELNLANFPILPAVNVARM